ncbi:hypothetical protein V6N12_001588 [Hibiscus sabdariffa]|uniref:Uncharacterized protein n=1 Tax=Hibiscus sabdariffa TaxID=183260 RepID=A0ABR1ZTC3_9ROSI
MQIPNPSFTFAHSLLRLLSLQLLASTNRRSPVTCTAVRRLPSLTIVADHPLKLLQPPNRTRSKRKKENGQLFSSVSNNQEHVCSSRHCCFVLSFAARDLGIVESEHRRIKVKIGRELLYKKRIRTESLKTWLQSRQALIRIWISFCTRCLTKYLNCL